MGFNFGAGYAGLKLGEQIANQPRPFIDKVVDGAENIVENLFGGIAAAPSIIENAAEQALLNTGRWAQQEQEKKRRQQQAARRRKQQRDPYAAAYAAAAGVGKGSGGSTKMSRKEQEKAINAAILAARAPYDQAIAEARAGLKDALTVNKRLKDNVKADVGGNDARADVYRKQVNAEAAALVDQAEADNSLAKYGGVDGGGEAAQRATGAADMRKAVAGAQAAGSATASDMQNTGAKVTASGINDFLAAEEASTRGSLSKQAQKQVQRLQKERAAAIAQARAAARSGIMETNYSREQQIADARQQAFENAMSVLSLQQQAQNQQANRALRQAEARAKAEASMRPDPMEALKLLIGATSSQIRTPTGQLDKSGRPVYGYDAAFPMNDPAAQAILAPLMQAAGVNGFATAQPNVDFGSMLGGWLKGLIR